MSRKITIDRNKPNIIKEEIACGTLFITIGVDTEGKIRFFFNTSRGGCEANLRAIAALLTRFYNDRRFDNKKLIEDLEDIDCKATMRKKGKLAAEGKMEEIQYYGNSCPNTISRVLRELEIKEEEK